MVQRRVDSKQIRKTVNNGWWQKFALQYHMQGLWWQILTHWVGIMIFWKILSEKMVFLITHSTYLTVMNRDCKILKVTMIIGSKNPCHVRNDTKLQITVLACTSASDITIPPLVIFDHKTLNPALATGEVPGTLYGLSHNGWWLVSSMVWKTLSSLCS